MEKLKLEQNFVLKDFLFSTICNEDIMSNSKSDKKMLLNTLNNKDQRHFLHSKRVSKLCKKLAQKIGLSKEQVEEVRLAGLMHDIGKLGISSSILNSKKKLTDEQFTIIKKHSSVGCQLLKCSKKFLDLSKYVLEHHERWDGTGYPDNLSGENISIPARIISIADSYDAMISDRPYRKALSKKFAREEIKRCAGSQFDPYISKIFITKVLNKKY